MNMNFNTDRGKDLGTVHVRVYVCIPVWVGRFDLFLDFKCKTSGQVLYPL
jgi:hypothetical protein